MGEALRSPFDLPIAVASPDSNGPLRSLPTLKSHNSLTCVGDAGVKKYSPLCAVNKQNRPLNHLYGWFKGLFALPLLPHLVWDSWVRTFKHGTAEGAEWCWTSEAVAFKFQFLPLNIQS
ncbi:hypothetical protein PPYC1_08180 [Paenibacillus polymyxa]|nr:hypothetical protein PPYC1_08180 [Paenibacillus polymyxa]